MEAAVACRAAPDQGKDVFVNAAPLFKPLWGRGAFGGAVLAQALSAAQATVPADFVPDTMHCHFFVGAKTDEPLYSHVERLRDGRSIATRSVRAMQGGRCVFAAMLNFGKAGGRGPRMLEHQAPSPLTPGAAAQLGGAAAEDGETSAEGRPVLSPTSEVDPACPFESVRLDTTDGGKRHEEQRLLQLTRAKFAAGSDEHPVDRGQHLAALAYMTDSYFLGTLPRVHRAHRFSNPKFVQTAMKNVPEGKRSKAEDSFGKLAEEELADAATRPKGYGPGISLAEDIEYLSKNVEMMVSLDHSIFFHNQDVVRADGWMVMEMETPWAGGDRGIVQERIFNNDGVLLATCIQEGLIRISQKADSHL